MMTLSFTLNRQIIIRTDGNKLVAGSQNYVRAKFTDVCGDWTRPITAIFGSYTQILDDNGECIIPWEAVQSAGTLTVSAFCGSLHTANSVSIPILPTGYTQGQTPQPPTPDVYAQLTELAQNAIEVAQSVRDEADAGDFDGPPGPQGDPGVDGVQINDAAINTADAWSSRKIVDTLCPAFEETGNPVVCYPVANYPLGVKASWQPQQEGTGDPSPENVRPITGLDAVTVTLSGNAGTGTTATLTLPETIYGGTVDAVTGEGMETWKTRALNGSEGWGEADDGAFYFYDTITYPTINAVSSRKCSHFMDYSGAAWTGLPNGYFSTNGVSIRFRLDSIADVAAWKSFLSAQAAAGTPVTIAYKLATPEPFQATGGQSLPALPGTNTIYTDADSVTVSGRTDPLYTLDSITERLAALEAAAIEGSNV